MILPQAPHLKSLTRKLLPVCRWSVWIGQQETGNSRSVLRCYNRTKNVDACILASMQFTHANVRGLIQSCCREISANRGFPFLDFRSVCAEHPKARQEFRAGKHTLEPANLEAD